MALFQKSVLNKHLNHQDENKVAAAFAKFNKNYSLQKIEQIKQLKEEEYQGGFLRDIFVDVFGYTLRPEENYNLQREFKNQNDGKKADGAILKNDKAQAIIELKSTNTKDLTKVTNQAFNYKNNQPECKYVITSNFQKLRFYIDYAHEYEEFNLFNLQKDEFKLLYLILHKDNLLADVPLQIKKETKFHEQEVSSKLYKDYSSFKRKLFENLVKNHPETDKLELFKKSQKLLDRFLFILFSEDSGLLPPNLITTIITKYRKLEELDYYQPLYNIFKQYFGYINNGDAKENICEYNGGLFKADKLLDNLIIDDIVLINDLMKLSIYDFNTEVDVNILGHIFEHSLNEIEEITAQIEGTIADKKKSKRKKDGVFYTPKYITQYIVDNTVGTLCNEKRIELGIEEIEFDGTYRGKKGRLKKAGEKLYKTLNAYKDWLLTLKILDPACGSGAFLNQALNFLIAEHKNIDDILEELTGHSLPLFDTDKSILENNLFGVDINEESVEIAQLSLWLCTAKKGRKLSSLNNNIKCGNSLIDDVEVAGDKAFDWNVEFKEIMDNGGFDVVIGNPPYVKEATNKSAFIGLHHHACYQGKMDLWYFFGSLALEIINKNYGLIGFIAPNNWITNDGASKFRNIVVSNSKILSFVDFGDFKIFDSAGIQTMIYIMKKSDKNQKYNIDISKINYSKISHENVQQFLDKKLDDSYEYFKSEMIKNNLINAPINFINLRFNKIIQKIKGKQTFNLHSKEIASGIDILQDFVNKKHELILDNVEVGDGIFNLSQEEYNELNFTEKEKKLIKPFYTTKELQRYFGNNFNKYWVIYTDSSFKDKNKIIPYPNIKKHLDKYIDVLTSVNKPYGLHRSRDKKYFTGEKILSLRKCSNRPQFTYTDFDVYINRTFMVIKTERLNLKYLTGVLNSALIAFWLKYKGKMQGNNYQVDKTPLLKLPLIEASKKVQLLTANLTSHIIVNTQKQIDYNLLLDEAKLCSDFDREILLTKKLDEIESEIRKADTEINHVIYKLYGLTNEEIVIIEGQI